MVTQDLLYPLLWEPYSSRRECRLSELEGLDPDELGQILVCLDAVLETVVFQPVVKKSLYECTLWSPLRLYTDVYVDRVSGCLVKDSHLPFRTNIDLVDISIVLSNTKCRKVKSLCPLKTSLFSGSFSVVFDVRQILIYYLKEMLLISLFHLNGHRKKLGSHHEIRVLTAESCARHCYFVRCPNTCNYLRKCYGMNEVEQPLGRNATTMPWSAA